MDLARKDFVESSRIYDVVKESMRNRIDEYAEVMCFVQRWLSLFSRAGFSFPDRGRLI